MSCFLLGNRALIRAISQLRDLMNFIYLIVNASITPIILREKYIFNYSSHRFKCHQH